MRNRNSIRSGRSDPNQADSKQKKQFEQQSKITAIVADVDTPRNPATGRGGRQRKKKGLNLEIDSQSTLKS